MNRSPAATSLARIAGCLSVMATLAATAHGAQTFAPPTGWVRPANLVDAAATNTTTQHWDVFSAPAGPNAPDVRNVNPAGIANAFDAFSVADPNYDTSLTSSGNLYAGHSPIRMNVVIPNYAMPAAQATRFLLQFRFRGSETFDADGNAPVERDLSRLFIDGVRIDSLADFAFTEMLRTPSGSNSNIVEQAITFSLPGNASSYTIEWTTPARGSASQDEVSVDTSVLIPEPAAGVALGLLALVGRRRRLVCPRRREAARA